MKKITSLLLLLLFSCGENWSYQNEKDWSDLDKKYKFCKIGYNQSPIDIKDDFTNSDLQFSYGLNEVSKEKKDYALRINFYDKNSVTRLKKKYFLRHLVFHHPSEHLVDGKKHSLEMQIAHKSDDEQWLIMSVFLEVGSENPQFSDLINFISSSKKDGEISLENIVKSFDKFFFYDGSFTTPPCKEGVKWYVAKKTIEISKEQMNEIIKKAIFVKTNSRSVQEFHPEKY